MVPARFAMSGCYTAEDRAEFLRLILFFFSQLLAAPMRKTAGFGAEPQDYLRENRMNLFLCLLCFFAAIQYPKS